MNAKIFIKCLLILITAVNGARLSFWSASAHADSNKKDAKIRADENAQDDEANGKEKKKEDDSFHDSKFFVDDILDSQSCILTAKDDYAGELNSLLRTIKSKCPEIGQTDIIDKYVEGYTNRRAGLPEGATCATFSTFVQHDYKSASKLPSVLTSQPNNSYADCWVYTYNQDTNITTYVNNDTTCLNRKTTELTEDYADTCGEVRKKVFNDETLTSAIQNITNQISKSKDKSCIDVTPQAIGLLGELLGTTAAGIIAPVTFQIFSGSIQKLFHRNDNSVKRDSRLKDFLKEKTGSVKRSAEACRYYKMVAGILACKVQDPDLELDKNECKQENFPEVVELRRKLEELKKELSKIQDAIAVSRLDLNNRKSKDADEAMGNLNVKFYSKLDEMMKENFPDPSTKAHDSVTLENYLKNLSAAKADDSLEVRRSRKQLSSLLETIKTADDLIEQDKGDELNRNFLKNLTGISDTSRTVNNLDLDILTSDLDGLKQAAAHDKNENTKKKITAAAEIAGRKHFNANRDLNVYAVDPEKAADVKKFVQDRVQDYRDAKTSDNEDYKRFTENQAIKACVELAPAYYYNGSLKGTYESTLNSNFKTDYDRDCKELFSAPGAEALARFSQAKDATAFKADVCNAKGARAK